MNTVDPALPDDFELPETVSVQPVTGGARARARRSGKTFELATQIAPRCGLEVDTVLDLLAKGWTYEEFINRPARWVDPTARLTQPVEAPTL